MNVDHECVPESDILALQLRLLEEIRSSYKDMPGADKQMLDLLGVVIIEVEKGGFTQLESFDKSLPRGSHNKKAGYSY